MTVFLKLVSRRKNGRIDLPTSWLKEHCSYRYGTSDYQWITAHPGRQVLNGVTISFFDDDVAVEFCLTFGERFSFTQITENELDL